MGFGSGGGGFTPSPNNVPGSTQTGTDKDTDTHQFTGSVDITGSLTLNGSAITGGGGGGGTPGGADTQVQFNDAGSFGGSANFTFDGNAITVSDDADVANTLGKAKIGYDGTNADYANFSHRDQMSSTSFALQQRANGDTIINAANGRSVGIRINNANAMTVVAPNNNVAIGNFGAPTARLHITGTTGEQDLIKVDAADTSTAFFVTGSGQVGIGTGTPTALLHVSSSTSEDLFRVDHEDYTDNPIFVITGSGQVGIGTDDPSHLLHIQSSGKASLLLEADTDNTPESDTAYIKLTQDNNATRMIVGLNGNASVDPDGIFLANAMSNAGIVGPRTAGSPLQLVTSNRAKICVQDDGQVGIGDGFNESTRPTAILHVSGGIAAQGTAKTSPLILVEYDDNDNILFVTGSGRVGIGTGTPVQTLSVSGSAAFSGAFGSTAIETLTANGTISANTGLTLIDASSSLAVNNTLLFSIADGTFAGQEKKIRGLIISGSDGTNSTGIYIVGTNIDSPPFLGGSGQIVLSSSNPVVGPSFQRAGCSLVWDGSKWLPVGNYNFNINATGFQPKKHFQSFTFLIYYLFLM